MQVKKRMGMVLFILVMPAILAFYRRGFGNSIGIHIDDRTVSSQVEMYLRERLAKIIAAIG